MNNLLLQHILTGEATDEEKGEFYSCLETNKDEKELFFQVKKLWLLSSMPSTVVDTEKEFNKIWKKLTRKKNSIGKKILHYAAIILFVLGLGSLSGYFLSEIQNKKYIEHGTHKYTATRGSVSIVEFPDGTKVWLNSESELTFKEDHKKKQRLAELSGEAYFKITHRNDCPFVIKAGEIVVHDLGTTFNIKAYPEDKYIETSLVEGAADILTEDGKSVVSLTPGESAMYLKDEKRIKLRAIADNVLSAWRNGKFVIRDQRMEDIFNELTRWYGIEFQFQNNKLKDYRFTGNIKKSTTALHVLKVLKAATDFNFRIIEKVDEPDLIIVY